MVPPRKLVATAPGGALRGEESGGQPGSSGGVLRGGRARLQLSAHAVELRLLVRRSVALDVDRAHPFPPEPRLIRLLQRLTSASRHSGNTLVADWWRAFGFLP